ncbi:hypothetical protein ACOBV9_19085 (plasmid) [Pseudoalteromonas espejiana]
MKWWFKGRVSTLVDGVNQPFVADLTGDTGLWDMNQVRGIPRAAVY